MQPNQVSLRGKPFALNRYPVKKNEQLQAWSAGDEYLIQHLEEMDLPLGKRVLILNDAFGALSCALSADYNTTTISDSHVSYLACQHNLKQNQLPDIDWRTTTDEWPTDIDLVLMVIPKSNRYLKWLLQSIAHNIPENVPVISVNKAKEIHSSTLNIFEQALGDTTTSLAWKKHRLVFNRTGNFTGNIDEVTQWQVTEHNISLSNLANVYSGEKLDLGARFFLEHLPQSERLNNIIDLGCGNGVLSVKLAQLNPNAQILSVDESYMATRSCQMNVADNLPSYSKHQVLTNNCLEGVAENTADLVVCNPPFHQNLTVTDHIAWQMFCDAKHVLRSAGQLLVIGNRHLGYDDKLSRLFGHANVKRVAQNKKFVILQATK